MASMQERLSFKRLGKKVRATLVARSSGAPSPTENSESESPVEKAQSETRLPAIGRFKAASQGLVAQTRMRSLGEAGQRSPRARLVRRHPFFLMTSRDFKEQLASAMEPLADVAKELQEPVKAEDPYEQVWDVLVPATERPQAKARVLIGQGEAVPWHLKGIILAMDEHVKTLQVLYKDTLLTPDLEDSFMVGLAGQEVALGILQESPFTVQLNGPATNLYFLSHEKLEDLSQTFFQDHTKLVERAQKILSNLMSAWVQKFYSRCFPRLFSYASQDFMTALVGLISIRVIKGGDKICREGEPGNFGFYLHAGRAVAQRGKANIIRLSSDKRSWHSWWGMLEVCGTCVEQTCTVIAEMDCMIWVLQSKHAEELRLTFPRECNLFDKISARHLQLLTPHMDAMRSIAMFADCGKDFLEMLNSEFSQRICGRDEVIFRESEVGDEMFVLALGKCKVLRSGNNHPVSRLHPGSVFGGQAVLGISQTRKETVMADTVSDVRALSRKALLRVLEKFPEEEERILSIVEAHSQSRKAASMALEQASASEGGFSQDFTRMLVDNMFEQPFMVNQAILTQGTPGTHLVVLVHGIVEIEANGMVVATVTAPGIFGERGLLVTGSRSGATVRCTTVAECMMLPVDGPSTPVIRQLYEADMKKMELMLQKKMQSTVQTLSSEGQELPAQQPTSFLKNCDPSFLTRMAQHLEKQVFLPGQTLLEEGSDAGFSLLIQQGNASIEKGGRIVGRIGAGEFIGESVALGFVPSATATVRADERMLTFAINNTAFRELVDEFPEEKQRLLDLVQKRQEASARRRSSRNVFNQVVAVTAMQRIPDAVVTPEEDAAESIPSRPVKRLPGYRSGLNWVRQRKAALEDAMYVKMERTIRSGKLERCSPSPRAFEPLLPLQGYRVPEVEPGTAWNSAPQAVPPSVLRLKKSQRVYGRKVWLETCLPWRPALQDDSEAQKSLEVEARELPKLDEEVDEDKDRHSDTGSLRSVGDLGLPMELSKSRSLLSIDDLGSDGLASPSRLSQSSHGLEHDDSPRAMAGLSSQLTKWYSNSGTLPAQENPIAALSRFLQQEEVLEEHERQERERELLGRGFEAWRAACFRQTSPMGSPRGPQLPGALLLEDLMMDEELTISDLDYEDPQQGEVMDVMESEVIKRVSDIITNALEIARE